MSSTQPISCNSIPSPDSQLCCPADYVCTVGTSCVLPDDTSVVIDQRPCDDLMDVLDSDYPSPSLANSTSSPLGLPPRYDAFQIVFVYPAVVFAVLMALAMLACEMRRRRRHGLRHWGLARGELQDRGGAAAAALSVPTSRLQDDAELPSYAEHWKTGAQLRVDVESGVQPPKYPEAVAVLDVRDSRAWGMAPRTPPPVYR